MPLLLALLLTAAAPNAALTFIEDDYPAALAQARARKVPLFVDAWAPWCHTCVFMREHVFNRPELSPLAERFVFLSIDTEREANARFVQRFPLSSWPTLFVIDPKDESVALKWMGSADVADLKRLLAEGEATVRGGSGERERALAAADRLQGKGRAKEAAAAYRKLLDAEPTDSPRRGRLLNSLLGTLFASADHTPCVELAAKEAPRLPRNAAYASAIGWGWACASSLGPAADRALVDSLIAQAEEATGITELLADDRSGLYEALVDLLGQRNEPKRVQAWAQNWLVFLEGEAEKAGTPAARAVFDAHRVAASLSAGTPERALEAVQRSGRELPADYNPPAREAVLLRELGRLDEALVAVTRALGLVYGPRRIRVLETKASVLERMGRLTAREQAVREAIGEARVQLQGTRREETIARLERSLLPNQGKPMPPIVQNGAAVLRTPALDVPPEEIGTPAFQQLVRTMVEVMRAAPGVGLAAPQIGVNKRVLVLEDREELMSKLTAAEVAERQRVAFPTRVFINPRLRLLGEERATFFEGCLSVNGHAALVERALEVEVVGLDERGHESVWRVRGWPARILQHEVDHLDGTLYVDRMKSRSFSTAEQAKARFGGRPIAEVLRELGL